MNDSPLVTASVLPYLNRWDTACKVLLSLPRAEGAHTSAHWLRQRGLKFPLDIENLKDLDKHGRDDLSWTLISATADKDLLADIATGPYHDGWKVAVTANGNASIHTVFTAYGSLTVKAHKENAAENIAERLRTEPASIEWALKLTRALTTGPENQLTYILDQLHAWDKPHQIGTAMSLASVITQRQTDLPQHVWNRLVNWTYGIGFRNVELTQALTEHHQATTDDLLILLSGNPDAGEVAVVLSELIRRGHIPPRETLDHIWSSIADTFEDDYVSAITSSELAQDLYRIGGGLAQAAILSGLLPQDFVESEVRKLLAQAYAQTMRVWDGRLFELIAQCAHAELLSEVIEFVQTHNDATLLRVMARNPRLSAELQHRILRERDSSMVNYLIANPGVDHDVVKGLVDNRARGERDRWSFLLGNPAADVHLKKSMPAFVLREAAAYGDYQIIGETLMLLEKEIVEQGLELAEFENMLSQWHGTIGELATAITLL